MCLEHASIQQVLIFVALLDGVNGHVFVWTWKIVRFPFASFVKLLSRKRVESRQLHPTTAHLRLLIFAHVACEVSTHICASVHDTEHVEVHHGGDGVSHVLPGAPIVAGDV